MIKLHQDQHMMKLMSIIIIITTIKMDGDSLGILGDMEVDGEGMVVTVVDTEEDMEVIIRFQN